MFSVSFYMNGFEIICDGDQRSVVDSAGKANFYPQARCRQKAQSIRLFLQ
jgi:hypothetical protein